MIEESGDDMSALEGTYIALPCVAGRALDGGPAVPERVARELTRRRLSATLGYCAWRRAVQLAPDGPAAGPYGARRPLTTAVTTVPAEEETALDLSSARRIIAETPTGPDRLTQMLYRIHEAYGYLPWTVAELLMADTPRTMTDIYTAASLLPNFRGAPAGKGTAVPRGGRKYTGNLGIAGTWPEVTPPPAHDRLRELEAHHPTEPAFAR